MPLKSDRLPFAENFSIKTAALLRRYRARIVRMRGPVAMIRLHSLARAGIDHTVGEALHRDAVFDRADIDAEVTGNTLVVDHLERPVL